jgi:hypothetical protein
LLAISGGSAGLGNVDYTAARTRIDTRILLDCSRTLLNGSDPS